jgi:hypothetical protein
MGYRDDFYAVENVIGYSGKLSSFPTVYFQSATEAGHITQKHDSSQNVGRQAVFSSKGYVIENRKVNGERRLVEFVDGHAMHVSRSTFTAITGMTDGDKGVLYQAIRNNPNEKLISEYSEKDYTIMDETMKRHDAAMKQVVMPDALTSPPPLLRTAH